MEKPRHVKRPEACNGKSRKFLKNKTYNKTIFRYNIGPTNVQLKR